MNYLHVLLLAIIQGLCELLPVSSSAHVIVAEKLLGLDPTSPQMTFLLVMLHTGTMFAVIVYFWKAWRRDYFSSPAAFVETCQAGGHRHGGHGDDRVRACKSSSRKGCLRDQPGAEIEQIFGNLS